MRCHTCTRCASCRWLSHTIKSGTSAPAACAGTIRCIRFYRRYCRNFYRLVLIPNISRRCYHPQVCPPPLHIAGGNKQNCPPPIYCPLNLSTSRPLWYYCAPAPTPALAPIPSRCARAHAAARVRRCHARPSALQDTRCIPAATHAPSPILHHASPHTHPAAAHTAGRVRGWGACHSVLQDTRCARAHSTPHSRPAATSRAAGRAARVPVATPAPCSLRSWRMCAAGHAACVPATRHVPAACEGSSCTAGRAARVSATTPAPIAHRACCRVRARVACVLAAARAPCRTCGDVHGHSTPRARRGTCWAC
jgi:hypothetical protein